jgi:L-lactate utilization protein LutB
MDKRQLKRNVNAAVADEHLQTALSRATAIFRFMRELTFQGLAVDELRSQIRAIKEWSIDNLPDLIARFTAEAEAVGAKVFVAPDAAAANRYIGELAMERGIGLAVKSKSMVTEEIGLNAYLRQRGVKAVETDLGEWIVQLAEERPSHMLAPAIHKPRE